jgi:riboflavin-specific deaminase-like protein
MTRPYVVLSAAISLDGRLDDVGPERLLLSGAADFDAVDELRASCDAILVGAGTLRQDDPRLLVRSDARRAERVRRGRPEHPVKVAVSGSGELAAELRFWHSGGQKVIYTNDSGAPRLAGRDAEVVSLGPRIDEFGAVLDDLGRRGIGRLLVEGGGAVHTAFLSQGLADELRVAVAPLLVGQAGAPNFLGVAEYPGGPRRRLRLLDAQTLGDVVVIRYAPKPEGDR